MSRKETGPEGLGGAGRDDRREGLGRDRQDPRGDVMPEFFDADLAELLGSAPAPVQPSATVKDSVFAAIEGMEQLPGEHAGELVNDRAGERTGELVHDGAGERTNAGATARVVDLGEQRRRRRPAFLGAAAAAVVILAGSLVAFPLINGDSEPGTPDGPSDSVVAQSRPSSPPTGESTASDAVVEGHRAMHAIMGAEDLRQVNTGAMGATLDIVVSRSMGKGGAMVDGAPQLADGMGAQVWAVMPDGSMESAGVIGPEMHRDVWMPLPGKTSKVMITEEPVAGSAHPAGTLLAEVTV